MRFMIGLICFFSLACASAPQPEATNATREVAKATREGGGLPPGTVELRSLSSGPAAAGGGLEAVILLNTSIQDCLRQAVTPEDFHFSVEISGVLEADGRPSGLHVSGVRQGQRDHELAACLTPVVNGLRFEAPAGAFHLILWRGGEVRGGKGFLLNLQPRKKFE
jgi:hypothetical protein